MALIDEEKKPELASEEKPEPLRVPWYEKIPFCVKAIFFKYWFIGLDYYLFAMGLSIWMGDSYNPYLQMSILGLAMGFLDDFMLYNIYGAFEGHNREAFWYEIYKNKSIWSTLINLVYGLVWAFAASYLCAYFASLIPETSWANGLFQEAFSFALVGLVIDAGFIALKDLPFFILRKKRGEEIHL
jgi:hypothetical protein